MHAPPENFEILGTPRCFLRPSEASFHACIQCKYIFTAKITLTNLWLAQLQLHYHGYKCSLLTVCVSATKGILVLFYGLGIRERFVGMYTLRLGV